MKIRPLHDRVVIRRSEEKRTSPGGIVIPDTANKDKPMFGEIVSVGSGKLLENGQLRALGLKIGDKVLFGKYAGTEVKCDDHDLVVMREDDILGVVE